MHSITKSGILQNTKDYKIIKINKLFRSSKYKNELLKGYKERITQKVFISICPNKFRIL